MKLVVWKTDIAGHLFTVCVFFWWGLGGGGSWLHLWNYCKECTKF